MLKFLGLIFVVMTALPTLMDAQRQQQKTTQRPTWLWVKDYNSGIGIPGAHVDIGPGEKCLGQTKFADVKWTAHYTADEAGRVLTRGLPSRLSCRVAANRHQLYVAGGEFQSTFPLGIPAWAHLHGAYVATLTVAAERVELGTSASDYWETTDDPTKFRSYIQDSETADLIPGVKITALPSGITTTSDANGLFTLEVPANYRKNKFPSLATQTLVFSKPGYKQFEYRQLVLHPGLIRLEVFLSRGTGTLVRTNGALSDGGNPYDDHFTAYPGKAPEHPPKGSGEIISVEISPYKYDGGWINCPRGAKIIVKARNLKAAGIGWTPTGTGVTDSVGINLIKVNTSPEADTWEAALSDIMSTHFAVGGTDMRGKGVASIDLGNVGCD